MDDDSSEEYFTRARYAHPWNKLGLVRPLGADSQQRLGPGPRDQRIRQHDIRANIAQARTVSGKTAWVVLSRPGSAANTQPDALPTDSVFIICQGLNAN